LKRERIVHKRRLVKGETYKLGYCGNAWALRMLGFKADVVDEYPKFPGEKPAIIGLCPNAPLLVIKPLYPAEDANISALDIHEKLLEVWEEKLGCELGECRNVFDDYTCGKSIYLKQDDYERLKEKGEVTLEELRYLAQKSESALYRYMDAIAKRKLYWELPRIRAAYYTVHIDKEFYGEDHIIYRYFGVLEDGRLFYACSDEYFQDDKDFVQEYMEQTAFFRANQEHLEDEEGDPGVDIDIFDNIEDLRAFITIILADNMEEPPKYILTQPVFVTETGRRATLEECVNLVRQRKRSA